MKLTIRPRRLRNSSILRNSLSENQISKEKLIVPMFLQHGSGIKSEISAMPGIYHFSIDEAIKEIESYLDLGLNKILLFGNPIKKDRKGTSAIDPAEIIPKSIRQIKEVYSDNILIIADVCLCAYTSHGHCGIPNSNGHIMNDESVKILSEVALTYATAGCDIVAPSDMMDGRIGAIRETLDSNNLSNISILSYAVKFASAYYGPFREAVDSAPQFGDRRSYQLPPFNARLALREAQLDEKEGADAIMVKPALPYLDIIYRVKQQTHLPIVAYNVSGEYSVVKLAGLAGYIDENAIALENLSSIARAGADLIITYHATSLAEQGLIK